MKDLSKLWIVPLMALVSLCMVSCGGDDDDDGGGSSGNYGQMQGKSGTIVRGMTWTSDNTYSPSEAQVFNFEYGGYGTVHEYGWGEDGTRNWYSYTLDNEFTPFEGNHWLFADKGTRSFSYSYNSGKDLYRLSYGDGPDEYYYINYGTGIVKQTDESGKIVYADFSDSRYYKLYDYALSFSYNSGSSSGGGGSSYSGTVCSVCNGTGDCRNCNGTGKPGYYDQLLGYSQCSFCKGSGNCSTCGGTGYVSSTGGGSGSGSGSGNGSDYDTYDYYSTTAIKVIKTGSGSKENYSKSTESMYKGVRKSDNKVFLFKRSKSLVGSASRNSDSYCGDYYVGNKDYKTTDPGLSSMTYYYFD